MAYDDDFADRIRQALGPVPGLTEKKMFGGLAFLVNGHMAVSASGQGGLLVRVDPAASEPLVAADHVEPMVMRGRAMDGWLRVAPEGVGTAAQLRRWVERGLAYASSLPPK